MGLVMYFGLRNKETNEYIECGYLRKANQIRGYFADKYEVENCTDTIIHIADVHELYIICETLLNLKGIDEDLAERNALELLPPTSGFFFGSQEIDHWYYEDLEQTQKIMKEIWDRKVEDKDDKLEIIYHEWW